MKLHNIIDAIGNIDEKYIDECALDKELKRSSPLKWIIPVAACIAFAVAAVLLFPKSSPPPANGESKDQVLIGEESSGEETSSEDTSSEDTPIPEEKLLWSGGISEGFDGNNITSYDSSEKLSDDILVTKSFYKYLTEEVADDEFVAFSVKCLGYNLDSEAFAGTREQRQNAEALYDTLFKMQEELYSNYKAKGLNEGEIRAKIVSDPEYAAAYTAAYDACVAVGKAELSIYGEIGEEYIKHLQSKGFKLIYGVENEDCETYLLFNGFVAVMAGTKEQFLALKNDQSPGKMSFFPAYKNANQLKFGFSYGDIEPDLPTPAEFTEEGLTTNLAELYAQNPHEKITVRVYYNLRYPTQEEAYERGWRSLGYESKEDYERDLNANLLDGQAIRQFRTVRREAINGKHEKQAVLDRVLKEGELFDTEAAGLMVSTLFSNCFYAQLSYERALEVAADEGVAYIEAVDFNLLIDTLQYAATAYVF